MGIDPSVLEEQPDTAVDRSDMQWVPGGTFRMGSDSHYAEERPVHRVTVSGFWIDRAPVTNRQFRRFVEETGHVTFAELPPQASDYPGATPELLYPGSLVFTKPPYRVSLSDCHNWWSFRLGADWRHPQGPESSIEGLDGHPVVHVTASDAEAYAAWAGAALPPEAEWEFAARGGLDGAAYAWGEDFLPRNQVMANTWQGEFPWQNLKVDGYEGTSPVGAFPPNGYGLVDMIGNVWEWTGDWFTPRHQPDASKACCIPVDPRGGAREGSHDPTHRQFPIPRRVLKGDLTCARPTTAAVIAPRPPSTAHRHVHVSRGIPVRGSSRKVRQPRLLGEVIDRGGAVR